jgi:sugar/nucleoside kinase (ribokinase family)
MTAPRYDVVGIGNAIVDIIARCTDDVLARHGVTKGTMRLVDVDTLRTLYADTGPAVEISGGSAANTIAGVAAFGGTAGFVGRIADDDFGRIFAHDITAQGVAFPARPVAGGAPTSRSLILVTPDGERTMNTYLGISTEFGADDVDADLVAAAGIVYLEGYLFDRPEGKAAFRRAVEIARGAGRTVSLTLSDTFCVDRHRDEFLDLIRSGVGVLFANEKELLSLYEGLSFEDAVAAIGHDTPLAAVTRSAKGALVVVGGQVTPVPAVPVATVVDTTGAGDLFAAGFLYGHARGRAPTACAALGARAAAEIISHIGARPEADLTQLRDDVDGE